MTTITPSDRIPLDLALHCLPVTHLTVVSDPQKPITFDKVVACLYRVVSGEGFEVLSSSYSEGAHALLDVGRYDGEEGVRYCVWGIKNAEVVGRLGRDGHDLRMHGERGTIVDGILLSPISFPDLSSQARMQRRVYRSLSSQW